PRAFLTLLTAIFAAPMYHPAAIGPIRSCDIAIELDCRLSRSLRTMGSLPQRSPGRNTSMKIDSSLAAVVTGGASGLGLATVKAFRAAGAKVAIFDLNPETGDKAAAETGAVFC